MRVCLYGQSVPEACTQQHSADTRIRQINVGSMFVHHLRLWTNVKPTLIQRLVFAGLPIHMYGGLYDMPIGHSLPNKTNIHSMWQ